jgi:hypothetical protein
MVAESEVMRQATSSAKDLVASAEREGRELRRGADEYARDEMARLLKVLSDSVSTVERGKGKLDQRLATYDAPLNGTGGSRASAPMSGDTAPNTK